jgi:hypothetical protein
MAQGPDSISQGFVDLPVDPFRYDGQLNERNTEATIRRLFELSAMPIDRRRVTAGVDLQCHTEKAAVALDVAVRARTVSRWRDFFVAASVRLSVRRSLQSRH